MIRKILNFMEAEPVHAVVAGQVCIFGVSIFLAPELASPYMLAWAFIVGIRAD